MSATEAQLKKRKLELEIERLEYDVEKAEAQAAEAVRDKKLSEASDWHNGIFHFVGYVNEKSVVPLIEDISEFRRYAPRKPVTVYMDSQGGLNTSGLHAYSFLCEVPKLTIHVRGWAASMAPVILQAATVRRMDREAHMMIHKSTMSIERVDADTFMLEAESLKVWSKQVLRIIASRSRLSEEELHERTLHRDWYLTAPEALELGFIDEVR